MGRMSKKVKLIWLFAVPQIVFAGIAFLTDAAFLITVLSATLFAAAVGVCFAYAPAVYDAMTAERELDRADWLSMGVFVGFFAIVLLRSWSILWRFLGKPEWLLNSDFVSYSLYMSLWAAIFHLAAPGAISDRVPARRWINIGIAVTIFILVAIASGYYFEAFALD
jgi:hypothetical protein